MGARNSSSLVPRSTTRPAYITSMRSAISAITPMSWVMKTMATAVVSPQLVQQVEDLRLHRHVQRRGRLVGHQQRGIAGQRHGDHHALAHAARQLVRIAVRPLPRASGCSTSASRSIGALPCGCLARSSHAPGSARRSASRPCRPASAPSSGPGRSWRSPCRAACASRRRLSPTSSRPRYWIEPVDDGIGIGDQAHHGKKRDRLAGPRLAHDAEEFAFAARRRRRRRPPAPCPARCGS